VQADGGREGVFDEIVVRDVAPGFDAVVFDDGDGGLRLTALADAQAGQGSTVLLESPGSPGRCAGGASGATCSPT